MDNLNKHADVQADNVVISHAAGSPNLKNPLLQKLPLNFRGETGLGKCAVQVVESISLQNTIDEILVFARNNQATDIHISVNNQIFFRKYGALIAQTEQILKNQDVSKFIESMLSEQQLEEFYNYGDLELIYVISGSGRYRVTIGKKTPGWDMTIRLIPMRLFSFDESGMPESCRELTRWSQGMVLVTGPIGCGKTTTLSVLTELINQTRTEHIITIENPIEVVFQPQKCQITQREINKHTLSQDNALRAALRQDPDILIVSELRDNESIHLAATAAETGHLVLGTMNTNDAAQTILRIVNSFSVEDRSLVQNMISESLRGIVCQQLIPRKDGTGLVTAYEVLVVNSAISNLIRKGNVDQILRVIATGAAEGMIPFDLSLMNLLDKNIICWEEAYARCTNKREFEKRRGGFYSF
ncbi:MAG: PilT/PilU family type 4a pilus ATPase [Candidatus Omnitrophica bacterium]|nr:PilT/PilU family type 4a pilus ATPase [Candidatus Omnitrophota bacterium]